jgi:hypothetical protein
VNLIAIAQQSREVDSLKIGILGSTTCGINRINYAAAW